MAEGDGQEVESAEEILAAMQEFIDTVRDLHTSIIRTSGGAPGEDAAKLFSAVARPFHTWDGKELYPTDLEKCAVIFHGIICGHVFTDGCKRTGTVVTGSFLSAFGIVPEGGVTPDQIRQMGELAVRAAQPGGLSVEEILAAFKEIFGDDDERTG